MPDYFEFQVALQGVEPAPWRRFQLLAASSFHTLHTSIQDACGWENYHLYLFKHERHRGTIAGIPAPEMDVPDASLVKLSSYFGKTKEKSCLYEYDFGDGWLHEVTMVRKVRLPETFVRRLLGGELAFPPEDSGGIGGYERCVQVARGGEGPWGEEEGLREWLGDWDPERFDLEGVKASFDVGVLPDAGLDLPDAPKSRRSSAEHVLADMTTYLDEDGEARCDLSKPECSLARYLGRIVGAATWDDPGARQLHMVHCRRRPGRKPCTGRIETRLQEVPPKIHWECPVCGDAGVIPNWEGTPWDRGESGGFESFEYERFSPVLLSDEELRYFREHPLSDPGSQSILMRGEPTRDGWLFEPDADELEYMYDRVADEADNAPPPSARRCWIGCWC